MSTDVLTYPSPVHGVFDRGDRRCDGLERHPVRANLVANVGGLIQVGGERHQKSEDDMLLDVGRIGSRAMDIIDTASREDIPTGAAGYRIVHERLLGARITKVSAP